MAQKNEELREYLEETASGMGKFAIDVALGKISEEDRFQYHNWLKHRMNQTIWYVREQHRNERIVTCPMCTPRPCTRRPLAD